jgi:hypothetical protein
MVDTNGTSCDNQRVDKIMLTPDQLTPEVRAELYASCLLSHKRLLKMAEFRGLTRKQALAHRALAADRLREAEAYKPREVAA